MYFFNFRSRGYVNISLHQTPEQLRNYMLSMIFAVVCPSNRIIEIAIIYSRVRPNNRLIE
jgi:hypothetical protein